MTRRCAPSHKRSLNPMASAVPSKARRCQIGSDPHHERGGRGRRDSGSRPTAPSSTICGVAQAFIETLEAKRLPRFTAFRHGLGNCHALVQQLYMDLTDSGVESLFTYKRGSSAKLQCDADPEGLHSWIEAAGWVIDASNGAHRPVLIIPVEQFYDLMQLDDVRDITLSRKYSVK